MNPYSTVDPNGFWRPAVADRNMFEIEALWSPKFAITDKMAVSTYGSCFAQHIGRNLHQRGYHWLRSEARPFGLSDNTAKQFNYDVFSSRTGNIYTTTLLLQWLKWAFGAADVPEEIWEKNSRFYDPFRPNVEPNGFASREEVLLSRAATLDAFKDSVLKADVFVFTLGLTERWLNTSGYEYPICPGTVAGDFDAAQHKFDNLEFPQVRQALSDALAVMSQHNPSLRYILTVSPVPLTATYSGKHVVVATMQSKSILRAVAGQIADRRANVDYFPSYEIINSPVFKGSFFEPNQRSVSAYGVGFVMDMFFNCQKQAFGTQINTAKPASGKPSAEDLVCEEELLDSVRGRK